MPNTEATKIELLRQAQETMQKTFSQDITEMKSDIKEIKTMLISNFVPIHDFDSKMESMGKAIVLAKSETDEKLKLAKKSATMKLITAVFITVVITGLISFFIQQVTDTSTLQKVTTQEVGK